MRGDRRKRRCCTRRHCHHFNLSNRSAIDRIVAYHERQDQRFAEAADELSRRTGKPILTATELAVADPENPGPATVRATGRLCYPSGNRAVAALGHLYRAAAFNARRGK